MLCRLKFPSCYLASPGSSFVSAPGNAVGAAHWRSGPRLFNEEASDIGSNLIAMALLQQQNRVARSPEKTSAH